MDVNNLDLCHCVIHILLIIYITSTIFARHVMWLNTQSNIPKPLKASRTKFRPFVYEMYTQCAVQRSQNTRSTFQEQVVETL